MANKKKKYNARFPPARIKKIMQKDEEVGKVAAPVPVIISRALELFVESLVRRASDVTCSRNAKTLTTSHLKACILADERLLFLKELVLAVPDVQGDEEAYEGPSLVGRPKLVGVRKRSKNGNSDAAGPSHSMAEETDSAEDEEDGYLDDETDDASSENATDVAPAMPAYKNPAAMVAYPHITPFTPVAPNVLQPSLLQKHNIAPSLIGAASKGDEDDYDS